MFFTFFYFSSSKEIYTKLGGLNNTFCHLLAPCSYEIASKIVKSQDFIFIQDPKIESSEDIERARLLFNKALAVGATVAS